MNTLTRQSEWQFSMVPQSRPQLSSHSRTYSTLSYYLLLLTLDAGSEMTHHLTYLCPVVYIGRRGHGPQVKKRLAVIDRTNQHLV